MATKKQKREAGIAKREAFEAEQRERGQHYLKLAQAQRAEERKKAEEARKEKAIARSKKMAAQHRAEKAAAMSKPGDHKVVDPSSQNRSGASGRRKKFQKSRNPKRTQMAEA